MWGCAVAALFVVLWDASAGAQESQEMAEAAQNKITANTNLVVLPVTVKDRSGNLVAGLTAGDFRVYDDGVEQSIDVFSAEGVPLSIVVLIDDDLKADDARETAPSLPAILAGISASDEAAICRFDLEFYSGKGFTGNVDRLLAELTKAQEASKERPPVFVPWKSSPSWHVRSTGEPPLAAPTNLGSASTKALDDAVYAAAEMLKERGRERRKIVLIVSDGINGAEFNKHNYEETLSELLTANVSVFSVAVGGTWFHKAFARLHDYSKETGGDIYYARKGSAMEQLYKRITEEARHEYTVAYEPRGNDRKAKYHEVQVRVRQDGMVVKTREGYYGGSGVR
jgi:VWFA-related protein